MARKYPTFFMLMLALAGILPSSSQSRQLSYEYQEPEVHTAFLYNFTRFVSWPSSAFADQRAPLVVCIEDSALFMAARRTLVDYRIHGRPVQVTRFLGQDPGSRVHVLVLGGETAKNWPAIREAVHGLPILTISALPEFAASGGMVEWFRKRGRLRFGVNLAAVRGTGMTLSAEVLRLADFVHGAERGR